MTEREPLWGSTRRQYALLSFSNYLKALLYRFSHRPIFYLLLLLLTGFLLVLLTVVYVPNMGDMRDDGANFIEDIQVDTSDTGGEILEGIMIIISVFASSSFLALLIPIFFLGFTPSIGGRLITLLVIAIYITTFLKLATHEPRPYWYDADVEGMECTGDFGMPSGHTVIATALYIFLGRELWVAMPGLGKVGEIWEDIFYPNYQLKKVKDIREDYKKRKEEKEALRKRMKEKKKESHDNSSIFYNIFYIPNMLSDKMNEIKKDYDDVLSWLNVILTVIIRMIILVIVPLIIIAIAFSRIYLGAHFWMQVGFGILIGLVIFVLWVITEPVFQRYFYNLVSHSIWLQLFVWTALIAVFLSFGMGTWFASYYTFEIPDDWELNSDKDCDDDDEPNFEDDLDSLLAIMSISHAALVGYSITTRINVRDWWKTNYCKRSIRAIIGVIGVAILFLPLRLGIPKEPLLVSLVFRTMIPFYMAVFWVFGIVPWIASHIFLGRTGLKDFEWESKERLATAKSGEDIDGTYRTPYGDKNKGIEEEENGHQHYESASSDDPFATSDTVSSDESEWSSSSSKGPTTSSE